MKQKRYWLRTGTALAILQLVIMIVFLKYGGEGHPPAIVLPLMPGLITDHYLTQGLFFEKIWILEVISLVEVFILGALVGLLYGIIKVKVQRGTTMN